MYNPKIGRFLQTDPIGYGDGMNWYAYVGGDPVNGSDPSGLYWVPSWTSSGGCTVSWEQWYPSSAPVSGQDQPHPGEDVLTVTGHLGPKNINVDCSAAINNITNSLNNAYNQNIMPTIGKAEVTARDYLCKAPTVGVGAGLDAYAIVGGSVGSGLSFNPRNGQVSASFDLGVGFGIGGGTHISGGNVIGVGKGSSKTQPIAGGGFNVNGTATAGLFGVGGSRQIIGSDKGDWSAGWAPGAELSANVNIGPHGQINLPALYNLGCK